MRNAASSERDIIVAKLDFELVPNVLGEEFGMYVVFESKDKSKLALVGGNYDSHGDCLRDFDLIRDAIGEVYVPDERVLGGGKYRFDERKIIFYSESGTYGKAPGDIMQQFTDPIRAYAEEKDVPIDRVILE